MKSVVQKIFIGIIVIIVLLIGAKSCYVKPLEFQDSILAKNIDKYGQENLVLLLSPNKVVYSKTYKDITEHGLFELKGEYAKHYIGGLYCIGSFPWGLRFYNDAEKVFNAEMKLTDKQGDSFPEIGDKFNVNIIIYKDQIVMGDNIYKRIELSEQEKINLGNRLKL